VAWRRHELALELRGFRSLSEGLRLRPDNLEGGIDTLRRQLSALGLAPGAIVLGIHGLSPADDGRARQLWNAKALRAGYTKMHAWLERSEAKLDRLPPQAAAAETLLLGRTVIRHIVRDPLLPEELLPGGERQALIERMRSYQVRARTIWLGILQEE
jgi:phenylacetic acid degradation operon negative regulatory protein